MPDFTGFFNPSAWGAWSQPNQSMAPKPPVAPSMGGFGASPPAGGPAQQGGVPAQPGGGGAPGGGGNPLSMLLGSMGGGGLMDKFNASPIGQKVDSAFSQWQQNHPGGMMGGAGNPMMAKFGGALMGGQNPLQAMMSNPNDFAKWAAMRRQQQPGQAPPMQIGQPQAPPSSTPQPPMPTQQTGMLGGLM